MKTRYIKYVLIALMLLPSVGTIAQDQSEVDQKALNEALQFLHDNMVYVEGGTYLKGEAKVSTKVESFYCCKYETTMGLYRRVMSLPQDEDDDLWPIMGPNWTQFQEFIAKLNTLTGKRYRLLTDDEWEYAARGGNKSKGYLYAGSNNIDEVAWYKDNLGNSYHQVGTKQPNELGLYDMCGSADEWCQDTAPSESSENSARREEPIVDPDWELPDPPDFGSHKYVRGGSLLSEASQCTVYTYYTQPSDWGMPTIGSRLAIDVSEYEEPEAPKFRVGLKTGETNSEIDHEADYISYNPQTQKFILPSTDEEGNENTKEVDIAQVDYISRAIVSKIQIPEGANLSASDVTILADGIEVDVEDDGSFTTVAKNVLALGKDDRIMYFSYASFDESSINHKITLDALETAVSLLIPALPNALFLSSDDTVEKLKQLLRDIEVTKKLALAIDRSIVKNGYLDMAFVKPEFETAINYLLEVMGRGVQPQQSFSSRVKQEGVVPGVKPIVPFISDNARMGFVLDDSQWMKGINPYTGEFQGYWNCTFSVTSVRFAAMALLLGHIDYESGTIVNYPFDDEMDIFNKLIPAYSSKVVYDRMTTIEGLYEQLQLLTLGDDHLHLFDEVLEKNVKFDFYKKGDCIMAMGPTTDPYLLLYHILNGVVCPIIKTLGGEISKYYNEQYQEEKYNLNFDGISSRYKKFVISLVKEFAKAKKITQVVEIINSDKSRGEKSSEIAEIIRPIVIEKIDEDLKEAVKNSGKSLLFNYFSSSLDSKIKDFEKFYKKETKIVETLFTCIDIEIAFLGLHEEPVSYLELEMGFDVPEAGLEEIPGHRF